MIYNNALTLDKDVIADGYSADSTKTSTRRCGASGGAIRVQGKKVSNNAIFSELRFV